MRQPRITCNTPEVVGTEWTVEEFSRAFETETTPGNQPHIAKVKDMTYEGGRAWYAGLRNLKEAKEVLSKGWASGAERIKSVSDRLTPPKVTSRKRKQTWTDDGEINVDRALAGEWDTAYRGAKRVSVAGPSTVDLCFRFGGSCSHSAEQLFWRGATCAIVTDLLENAGYSVRLVGSLLCRASSANPIAVKTDVIVKEANEPLRLDAVASVVAHAGIYRTFGFRAMITAPTQFTSGLGYWTIDNTSEIRSCLQRAGVWPESAVFLEDATNESDAMAEIARVVALLESGDLDTLSVRT